MNELAPVSPVSPLRQRLIDDMTMRHFSHETSVTICAMSDGSQRGWGARPTRLWPRTFAASRSSSRGRAFRRRR